MNTISAANRKTCQFKIIKNFLHLERLTMQKVNLHSGQNKQTNKQTCGICRQRGPHTLFVEAQAEEKDFKEKLAEFLLR